MKQQITIPFNQFSNFRTENNSGFLETAENVRHDLTGYQVMPEISSLDTEASTDTDPLMGSILAGNDPDGDFYHYLGIFNDSNDNIYLFKYGVFDAVTGTTGLNEVSAIDACEFDKRIIITQYGATPVFVNTGTTVGGVVGDSPPKCKTCCVVGDFVLMAHEYNPSTNLGSRIWNSEVGNDQGWTAGDNLCDYNDYWELGIIYKIVGHREYATILSSNGVSIMQYVGGDVQWQVDLKHAHKALIPMLSVVSVGPFVYYATESGFYVFDGNTSTELASDSTRELFGYDGAGLNVSEDNWIVGAYDEQKDLIVWYSRYNKHYVYNRKTNQFTTLNFPTTGDFDGHLHFYPVQAMDVESATTPVINYLSFHGTNNLVHMCKPTTTYLTPDLQTGFYELAPGSWCTITKVKPISSGATNEDIDIIAYDESKSAIDTVTLTTVGGGRCRQTGRYFKFRVQSDSTRFEGLQVEFTVRGSRS